MKTFHLLLLRCCRKRTIVLSFAVLLCCMIQAESRVHPVSISFLKQSWGFPTSINRNFSPFFPGLTAGICRLRIDKMISFPQSAYLGYFYNGVAGSALYLYGDQGIRSNLKSGFFAEFSLGLGYFHAFHAGDIYTRNSNDEYEKVIDFGKPSFMFSMSQSIGFDLSKKFGIPITPFIKYQCTVSYPYFDKVLPIRPSKMLHLGTLIYF